MKRSSLIGRRLLLYPTGGGFDYYIDSVAGSDSNTGKSAAQAKQNLSAV